MLRKSIWPPSDEFRRFWCFMNDDDDDDSSSDDDASSSSSADDSHSSSSDGPGNDTSSADDATSSSDTSSNTDTSASDTSNSDVSSSDTSSTTDISSDDKTAPGSDVSSSDISSNTDVDGQQGGQPGDQTAGTKEPGGGPTGSGVASIGGSDVQAGAPGAGTTGATAGGLGPDVEAALGGGGITGGPAAAATAAGLGGGFASPSEVLAGTSPISAALDQGNTQLAANAFAPGEEIMPGTPTAPGNLPGNAPPGIDPTTGLPVVEGTPMSTLNTMLQGSPASGETPGTPTIGPDQFGFNPTVDNQANLAPGQMTAAEHIALMNAAGGFSGTPGVAVAPNDQNLPDSYNQSTIANTLGPNGPSDQLAATPGAPAGVAGFGTSNPDLGSPALAKGDFQGAPSAPAPSAPGTTTVADGNTYLASNAGEFAGLGVPSTDTAAPAAAPGAGPAVAAGPSPGAAPATGPVASTSPDTQTVGTPAAGPEITANANVGAALNSGSDSAIGQPTLPLAQQLVQPIPTGGPDGGPLAPIEGDGPNFNAEAGIFGNPGGAVPQIMLPGGVLGPMPVAPADNATAPADDAVNANANQGMFAALNNAVDTGADGVNFNPNEGIT